jgi:uncharacterized membrane protein YhaH (DUF805 family)
MNSYLAVWLGAWKKYGVFRGRADRREFWTFFLLNWLIMFIMVPLSTIESWGNLVWQIFFLAHVLPYFAVLCRRLHDAGHMGVWMFVPLLNLILAAGEGTLVYNKYGSDPKGPYTADELSRLQKRKEEENGIRKFY